MNKRHITTKTRLFFCNVYRNAETHSWSDKFRTASDGNQMEKTRVVLCCGCDLSSGKFIGAQHLCNYDKGKNFQCLLVLQVNYLKLAFCW